jgi:NAD(P)-dependent dehydrogenase (short-subunit alcohol dehydrogenase family)
MTLRFDGQVALVTGGGRGIGRAHARLLAERGCQVVINDPGPNSAGGPSAEDPAGELAREIEAAGGRAVADRHSVLGEAEAVVGAALSAFGRLDIVINNAGTLYGGLLSDLTPEDWWAVTDVHFRGTVDVTRAAWPHLVASGAGRVVNTASTGMFGNPRATNYGSAKAAIFGFTRSAALEGAPYGVHVNCILPSAWTRMTGTMNLPLVREALETYYQPDHVAALVAWLCHAKTEVNGEAIWVGGGRAARVVLAAAPSVKVAESTPEAWAGAAAALLTDGPNQAMPTMNDTFVRELREVAPNAEEIIEAIKTSGISSTPAAPGTRA